MSVIRIFHWNVLSGTFDNSKYFANRENGILDSNRRYPLILKKIDEEINKGAIFSLVEVEDSLFYCSILPRFQDNSYHAIYVENNFNQGIVFACPSSFVIRHYEIVKISDLSAQYEIYTKSWNLASSRYNRAIMVELQYQGKIVTICNYHMPCLFFDQNALAIHTSFLLRAFSTFSKGYPQILVGDFNCTKNDLAYNLFFQTRDLFVPDLVPFFGEYHKIRHDVGYTTNTASMNGNFKDEIDHIFYRGDLRIQMCHCGKLGKNMNEMIPSVDHPSDHLFLIVECV